MSSQISKSSNWGFIFHDPRIHTGTLSAVCSVEQKIASIPEKVTFNSGSASLRATGRIRTDLTGSNTLWAHIKTSGVPDTSAQFVWAKGETNPFATESDDFLSVYGMDSPTHITNYQMLVKSQESAINPHVAALTDRNCALIAYEDVNGVNRSIHIKRFNPGSSETGITTTSNVVKINVGLASHRRTLSPCLVALPEGSCRLYYLKRDKDGPVDVACMLSRDLGQTWTSESESCLTEIYDTSLTTPAGGHPYQITKLRVIRGNDQYMMLIEVAQTDWPGASTNSKVYTETLHSPDGLKFTKVGPLSDDIETTSDDLNWARRYSIMSNGTFAKDHFIVATCRHHMSNSGLPADANTTHVAPYSYGTGSADVSIYRFASSLDRPEYTWQDVPMVDRGNLSAVLKTDATQRFSSNLTICSDDVDQVHAYGRPSLFGYARSRDAGLTWSNKGAMGSYWTNWAGRGLNNNSVLTEGSGSTYTEIGITSASVCWFQGAPLMVGNRIGADEGGSLIMLRLGGWTNLTWPTEIGDSVDSRQTQLVRSWLGFHHPSASFDWNVNGLAPTITKWSSDSSYSLDDDGVFTVGTTAMTTLNWRCNPQRYIGGTRTGSIGTDGEDIDVVTCVSATNTELSAQPYELHLRTKTNSPSVISGSMYHYAVRIISVANSNNLLRVRDIVAGTNLATVTMPVDKFVQIRAQLSKSGHAAVYYSPWSFDTETTWQYLYTGSLTQGNDAPNSAIAYPDDGRMLGFSEVVHVAEPSSVTHHRFCHVAIGSGSMMYDASAINSPIFNACVRSGSMGAGLKRVRDHRGQTMPSLRGTYVSGGLFVSAFGGDLRAGETFKLASEGRDPLQAIMPNYQPSPSQGWRGRQGDNKASIEWNFDIPNGSTTYEEDTLGLYIDGCNFPNFEVQTSLSGSWTTRAFVDLKTPITWNRQGARIIPNYDPGRVNPTFRVEKDELKGAVVCFVSGAASSQSDIGVINRNSSGQWRRWSNSKDSRQPHLFIDDAYDISGVGFNGTGSIWYPRALVLINDLKTTPVDGIKLRINTDNSAVPDSTLTIGKVLIGPFLRLGYNNAFESDQTSVAGTVLSELADGSKEVSFVKKPRRIRAVQGQDVPLKKVYDLDDDYVQGSTSTSDVDGPFFATPIDAFEHLRQYSTEGVPLVYVRKAVTGSSAVVISKYMYCSGAIYGRVTNDLTLQTVNGTEYEDELIRLPEIVVEEEL